MSILEPITRRLQRVVIRMDEYLTNQGVDTSEAKTIMDYVNLISEVPSGIQYVMEGYHLFKGNTEMTELPPDLHEERLLPCTASAEAVRHSPMSGHWTPPM